MSTQKPPQEHPYLYGTQQHETSSESRLTTEKDLKQTTSLVIERSKELYGYTPEEKTDENIKWMLKNGYLVNRKGRKGKRRKGRANK